MIELVLVDDQAIVRTGLRTMLQAEPDMTIVGEAADGTSAIAMIDEVRPHVALVDIRMPGIDGIETTRRLRVSAPDVRVCILTNYGVEDSVFDALNAGASGFLVKTDSPERIVSTIRSVAAGEFALGADTTHEFVSRFLEAPRPNETAVAKLATLTDRECEVFDLVARGLSNAEIASALYLGEGTVKTHVAHILLKLQLRDRVQVVVFAHANHVV